MVFFGENDSFTSMMNVLLASELCVLGALQLKSWLEGGCKDNSLYETALHNLLKGENLKEQYMKSVISS